MIKLINKIYLPFEAIVQAIKSKDSQQKMMNYYLKIKSKKSCAKYKI